MGRKEILINDIITTDAPSTEFAPTNKEEIILQCINKKVRGEQVELPSDLTLKKRANILLADLFANISNAPPPPPVGIDTLFVFVTCQGQDSTNTDNHDVHIVEIEVYDMDGKNIAPTMLNPRAYKNIGSVDYNKGTIRNCYDGNRDDAMSYTYLNMPSTTTERVGLTFEFPNNTITKISGVNVVFYYADGRRYNNIEIFTSTNGSNLTSVYKIEGYGPPSTKEGLKITI